MGRSDADARTVAVTREHVSAVKGITEAAA